MTTIRTLARAALATVCTITAASTTAAADKPKATPPTKQLVNRPTNPPATTIASPRDAASGLATGKRQHTPIAGPNVPKTPNAGVTVVKPVGGGQAQTQKVDGWGVVKGVGNILSGGVKVVKGNVDAGVDQVKHGGEQIKASTDKDPTNDPSKQGGVTGNNNK